MIVNFGLLILCSFGGYGGFCGITCSIIKEPLKSGSFLRGELVA